MDHPLIKMSEAVLDTRHQADRNRVINNLNYLCVNILDYTLMDNPFNKDVASFLVAIDGERNGAIFTPRSTYKSTLLVADIIRALLIDPTQQIFFVHHRLSQAREYVAEVARHIQFNDKLRALFPPQYLPHKNEKWATADEFSMKNRPIGCRHPSLMACSINQVLTGSHPTRIYLDDLVNSDAEREITGGLDAVEDWVRKTLTNIRGLNPTCKVRLAGTPYTKSDFHWKIISRTEAGWRVYLRPVSEDPATHKPLEPESGGQPIPILIRDIPLPRYLNKSDLLTIRSDSGSSWFSQYMMLPRKDAVRIWVPEKHEHFQKPIDYNSFINKIVVINDPAPYDKSSWYANTDKKDAWAIAVIAYAMVPLKYTDDDLKNDFTNTMLSQAKITRSDYAGARLVRILIDGDFSPKWTLDQGISRAISLAYKYSTPLIAFEEPPGSAKAIKPFSTRCKEMAVAQGLGITPVQLLSTFAGKGIRIQDLAALAERYNFVMLKDTIPDKFLERFLEQARNWSGPSKHSHDDVLDAVSYLDDPAIKELLPKITRNLGAGRKQTYRPNRSLGKYF